MKGICFFNKLSESDQKDFLINYERYFEKEATDYLDRDFEDMCSFLINCFEWEDNDEQWINVIRKELIKTSIYKDLEERNQEILYMLKELLVLIRADVYLHDTSIKQWFENTSYEVEYLINKTNNIMSEFKGTKVFPKYEGGDNYSIDLVFEKGNCICIDRTSRYSDEIVCSREEMEANALLISKAPCFYEDAKNDLELYDELLKSLPLGLQHLKDAIKERKNEKEQLIKQASKL